VCGATGGDTIMASITGGCLCGKVCYSADVDPMLAGNPPPFVWTVSAISLCGVG